MQIGLSNDTDMEIISGLNEGDRIVTEGIVKLREDTEFRIKGADRNGPQGNTLRGPVPAKEAS